MPRTDTTTLSDKHVLGRLCARGHDHERTGQSLRYAKGGACFQCVRENASKPKGSARAVELPKGQKAPAGRRSQPPDARALPSVKHGKTVQAIVELERSDLELLADLARHEAIHGRYTCEDPLAWRRLELHGLVRVNGRSVDTTLAGWERAARGRR